MAIVYFAHPRGTYNTPLEEKCVQDLYDMDFENVLNPNTKAYQMACQQYKNGVMPYFTEILIPQCDALAFLSFNDGAIGAGCADEIMTALDLGLPVFEVRPRFASRFLTPAQTAERQPHVYGL